MIQRIQSVLLLLAFVANICFLFIPSWEFTSSEGTEEITAMAVIQQSETSEPSSTQASSPLHMGLFTLTILASAWILLTIFQYKNRPKQIKWAYVAIMLTGISIILLALLSQQGPSMLNATSVSGIAQAGIAGPAIAILLIFIAIRRIKKDEELVRSVDRIR